MEVIKITGTDDTPNVILDTGKGVFEFSGRSLPEDVISFYGPVLQSIEEYIQSPKEKTEINIKLDYFNTASSKVILDILIYFETIAKQGKEVVVHWYYQEEDEDMEEAGEEYAEIVDVKFKMHTY